MQDSQRNKDLKYLKLLAQVAETGDSVGNARLAAMIVYKNTVSGIGVNQRKSHPLQNRFKADRFKIYLHAEISAIIKSMKNIDDWQLKKATIYVCRIGKDGKWRMARPCKGCWAAIAAHSIGRVVWTVDHNIIGSWNIDSNVENIDESIQQIAQPR